MNMGKKENPEDRRLVLNLADRLGVNLEKSRHAVATKGEDAIAEKSDGTLKATLNEYGMILINGDRLPAICIEVIDPKDPNTSTAPKEAAYTIHAAADLGNERANCSGVMYIDICGNFITNRNVAQKILQRSDYKMRGED